MISVIISGANGQLGKSLVNRLSFMEDYTVFSFDRSQVDIADQDKIHRTLAALPQVRYWINCGAYTKVDAAESNEKESTLYNALAPGYLARACWEAGVHLFHFSSDYVYDNQLHRPLKEDDPTQPKGVYAKTKLEGEQEVIYSGARTNDEVRVVGDQVGAPTYTIDIADVIKDLINIHIEEHESKIQGVFNFANSGEVSWADFARAIFKHANLPCNVKTITTAEFNATAPRPAYSVMNCDKISELLSFQIPHWEDALQRYLLLV